MPAVKQEILNEVDRDDLRALIEDDSLRPQIAIDWLLELRRLRSKPVPAGKPATVGGAVQVLEAAAAGTVIEVEVAGPSSMEASAQLSATVRASVARCRPRCLILDLRNFELPFQDHLLASFVVAYHAMIRANPRSRFALVAAGKVAAALEELLRITRLNTVLGRTYPDAQTALADSAAPALPDPPGHS